jgi:hypothetical protein
MTKLLIGRESRVGVGMSGFDPEDADDIADSDEAADAMDADTGDVSGIA